MYATQSDMIARFGEDEIVDLTDLTTAGVIDDVRLSQALADAGAMIDGYLAARYSLPLSSLPAILTIHACAIARYLLCKRPTDEIRKRYEDAVAYLEKVARGNITLGLDASGSEPAPVGGPAGVSFVSRGRTFSEDLLNDFSRGGR